MRVNYHLGFSLFLVVLYSVVEVSGMLWDSFRDSFGGGRGGEGGCRQIVGVLLGFKVAEKVSYSFLP